MVKTKVKKCSSCKKIIKVTSDIEGLCNSCYIEKENKEKKKYIAKFVKECNNNINEVAEYFYGLEKRLKQIESHLAYVVFRGKY